MTRHAGRTPPSRSRQARPPANENVDEQNEQETACGFEGTH